MFFSGGGDPFEHFANGRHRSSKGGVRGSQQDAIDTNKLYETLGVCFEPNFFEIYILSFKLYLKF